MLRLGLRTRQIFAWLPLFLALTVRSYAAQPEPLPLAGETFVHDPSTILKEHGHYFLFGTGRGILSKSSPDLIHWTNGPAIFTNPPAWTTNAVPGYRGHTWAPDVIHLGRHYLVYYSVSTFGKQVSAIGLVTSPTLDPTSPDYHWTDRGEVLHSTNGSPFNAIDPSVYRDRDDRLWLAFGSFWKGIYLVELSPQTGLRLAPDSPVHRLAWNDAIEAACLTRHGDYHYLFVNWGRCCRGTNSTYEVRVGRSQAITGPYLDRDGRSLVDGGGSPFLETAGRFIGPGHIGLLEEGGTNWFSYHYYDAATDGRSRLAVGRLEWSPDGWPVAQPAEP